MSLRDRSGTGAALALACALSAVAAAASAAPQPGAAGASDASSTAEGGAAGESSGADARLEQAKQLFREGLALRKAGDTERALERFLASRALSPSVPNTLNAAVCLREVGRFDEALELYEELIAKMDGELTAEERKTIAAEMSALRSKVGSIEVHANVAGSLVVDGRARGSLPLAGPLRVLPGRHVVTVIKEGYASGEATVDVAVSATAKVELRLEPLASSGRLRVDDAGKDGAEDVAAESREDESGARGDVSDAGAAWLELFGGLAIAPSFGSGVESSCDSGDCSSNPVGLGGLVGLRGGWEFPIGLSIELGGGYFRATKTVERTVPTALANGDAVSFRFTDELSVSGPFAGAGLGYRLGFGEVMELRAHLLVGALFGFAGDTVTGSVSDGQQSMAVRVEGSGESVSAADLFVMPSVGLGMRFDGFGFGIEATGALYALGGPDSNKGFAQAGESCGTDPSSLSCRYSDSAVIAGEASYGTFFVIVPSAYVGYAF